MRYIGCDIGSDGAFVIIDDDNITKFSIPKIGGKIDLRGVANIVENSAYNCHVVLEDLHAIFGSAAASTFSFGHINGFVEGVLISNNIPYTKVQPKVWQKEMFQGIPEIRKPSKPNKKGVMVQGRLDTKKMSILASKRLFPSFDLRATERSKKDHDGISDALLMAEYCRRHFK